MSNNSFVVEAEVRSDTGKGASRRLRRAGKVPAILYGGKGDPVALTLHHDSMIHALEDEAFYSHILTVKVDGKAEKAVLRDLQRHPYKSLIMHMDFQRVSEEEVIRMVVPLHFINEDNCKGVKQGGGVINHSQTEVEISCKAGALPEYIEVDLAEVEVGQTVHLSDLVLPEGVEIPALAHGVEHDLGVVTVHAGHGTGGAVEGDDEEAEGGE
jgi:large subunit ribosomal protein L25